MSKVIKKSLGDTLGFKGELKTKHRIVLEDTMFSIAIKHAYLAQKKIHERMPASCELQHSLITIVMSSACLEGFFNDIGQKHYTEKIWKRLEWSRLDEKWEILVEKLRDEPLGESDQVLVDKTRKQINGLKDLRNQIVHYKARWENILPRVNEGLTATKERELYNAKAAKEAIKTVSDVIDAWKKLGGYFEGDWKGDILDDKLKEYKEKCGFDPYS